MFYIEEGESDNKASALLGIPPLVVGCVIVEVNSNKTQPGLK